MYLCICNAIRESEVDGLVAGGGARTVGDVYRALGKQPQCGSCASAVRDRVKSITGNTAATLPVAAE
ncbi:MAG: (2Fe-2S)-binding protein [Alphaproteobacteria bacterium]